MGTEIQQEAPVNTNLERLPIWILMFWAEKTKSSFKFEVQIKSHKCRWLKWQKQNRQLESFSCERPSAVCPRVSSARTDLNGVHRLPNKLLCHMRKLLPLIIRQMKGNWIFQLWLFDKNISTALLKDLAIRIDVGRSWFTILGRFIINDCLLGDDLWVKVLTISKISCYLFHWKALGCPSETGFLTPTQRIKSHFVNLLYLSSLKWIYTYRGRQVSFWNWNK